jgi:hypothetical protein
MKQVTESDFKEATKTVKEYITYDLPKSTSKRIRQIVENIRKN